MKALIESLDYLLTKYGTSIILNELKDETYLSAARTRLSQNQISKAQSLLSHSKNMLLHKFQNTLKSFNWFSEFNCTFKFMSAGIVQRLELHLNDLPLTTNTNNKWKREEPTLPQNILSDIISTCKQFSSLIHGMDYYQYYFYKDHTMISFIILSRELPTKVSKTLYHVTNKSNLNKILSSGLRPQPASDFWETYTYNALFAVQSLSDIKRFIKHANKSEEFYVISFTPPQSSMFYKDLIEINDGMKTSVYTHDSIPLQNIKEVFKINQYKELEKIDTF